MSLHLITSFVVLLTHNVRYVRVYIILYVYNVLHTYNIKIIHTS